MKICIIILFIFWLFGVIQTFRHPEKINEEIRKVLYEKDMYSPEFEMKFRIGVYTVYTIVCIIIYFIFWYILNNI